MDYRRLGASGFKVPELSMGTGTFGGGNEFFAAWGATTGDGARRLVDICLESGLNMFDSADIYSNGLAEEVLGQAIAGRRDKVIISTKATFRRGDGPNDVGSSRHHLRASVEGSLKRLGTDYIDLYQLHGFDAHHARSRRRCPPSTMLVRQGKIRYIGVLQLLGLATHEVARRLGQAQAGQRYVAHQAYYSLVGRDYEHGSSCRSASIRRSCLRSCGARSAGGASRARCAAVHPHTGHESPAQQAVDRRWARRSPDEYLLFKRRRRAGRHRREGGRARPSRRSRSTGCCVKPDRRQRHHRRARREAAARQPRRGRLGADARAGQATGRRERRDEGVSVLAPGAVRGAQSGAGLTIGVVVVRVAMRDWMRSAAPPTSRGRLQGVTLPCRFRKPVRMSSGSAS